MSAVFAVVRVASLGAVAFSWWADRRGRRRPFLAAFVVTVVASVATAAAGSPATFAAAQSVSRIATTAMGTLGAIIIAEQIEPELRAFVIGLYAAAVAFGAGIAQMTIPLAAAGTDAWRVAFLLPVTGLVFLRGFRRLEESPLIDATPTRVPVWEFLTGDLRARFWLSGIAGLFAAMFGSVGLAFTTERLLDDVGLAPAAVTAVVLVGGTTGALGFWIGGRMSDVWGRRPTTIVALAASTVGGVTLFTVDSLPVILLSLIVGGFGTTAYVPAATSHRAELFPTRVRATAGSAGAYLATIGSAVGLAIGGFAFDRAGLTTTMVGLAGASAAAMVLTAFLPETKGQALTSENIDR
jgi:MFS family permease